MLDTYEQIRKVLQSEARIKMKDIYKLDTVQYSWVESYLRDKAIRESINKLNQEIAEFNRMPMHKDDLREHFEGFLEIIKNERRVFLQQTIANAQNRSLNLGNFNLIMRQKVPYLLTFSQKEIDGFFAGLPDGGPTKAEIELMTRDKRAEIEKLNKKIKKELSPPKRWFHTDVGDPVPYPTGCRWTLFVNDWTKVASRFSGFVTIEGIEAGEEERAAYVALGLDRVRKLTPLREPRPAEVRSYQEEKASVPDGIKIGRFNERLIRGEIISKEELGR